MNADTRLCHSREGGNPGLLTANYANHANKREEIIHRSDKCEERSDVAIYRSCHCERSAAIHRFTYSESAKSAQSVDSFDLPFPEFVFTSVSAGRYNKVVNPDRRALGDVEETSVRR
jgi:hypothetical protein